jgi:hypothetical protein
MSRKVLGGGTARGTRSPKRGSDDDKNDFGQMGMFVSCGEKLEMRGKKNLKGSLKIRANNGEEKTAASGYEMEMQGVRGEWIRSPT